MLTLTFFLQFCFWFSLCWLIWTYLGYPLSIGMLAKWFPTERIQGEDRPAISIVLAAKASPEAIHTKIDNIFSLHYPSYLLEVIVVLDGPVGPVKARSSQTRNVRILQLAKSSGKPAALRAGIKEAHHELIFFCDVRQTLEKEALLELVKWFKDPKVGAVSGVIQMSAQKGPGMYWRYEQWIRESESTFRTLVGATGAIYAIRNRLFKELPDDCILDDMFIPLQLALQGYDIVLEPKAVALDTEAELGREFQRKARTLTGNFQLLSLLPQLLSLRKTHFFPQLFCHKIMRLFCPYMLLLCWCSNVLILLLAPESSLFYLASFFLQGTCYFLAIADPQKPGKLQKLGRLCKTFALLNIAAIIGLKRFLQKDFSWTR